MAKLILSIAIIVFAFTIGPLCCMWAWNGFAEAFNLPTFTFWHWLATVLAFRALLGGPAKLRIKDEEYSSSFII
jgi:hypothetical protein